MDTQRHYLKDTYQFSHPAQVSSTQSDVLGHYILLDQTIFYPQGGGQPSDQGNIIAENIVIPIHQVKCVDNEIRHYTNQDYSHLVGKNVECSIFKEIRLLHSQLHTAGHLVSNIVENLYSNWTAQKGHHFPKECYVEFSLKAEFPVVPSLDTINQEIIACIMKDYCIETLEISNDKLLQFCPNINYAIPNKPSIRVMRIGEFPYQPCGGTHIKQLSELNGLTVTKYKVKSNTLKIYYDIQ